MQMVNNKFTREYLYTQLDQCTEEQKSVFHRMYPKNPTNAQLTQAIAQVERTLINNMQGTLLCGYCETEVCEDEVGECVVCGEIVCEHCQQPMKGPPNPMVDYPIHADCYETRYEV